MKIIRVIPSKKFGGSWCAEEAPGVAPCFPGPNGKQSAIDYAQHNRFGGSSGEIRICNETLAAFLGIEEQCRRTPHPPKANGLGKDRGVSLVMVAFLTPASVSGNPANANATAI